MSRNPDVIASCLHQEEAEEWNRLYDEHQIIGFCSQQEACYCDNCGELKDALVVGAELADGSKRVFGHRCSKCHKELLILDLNKNPVCPVCKSADLRQQQTGLWD